MAESIAGWQAAEIKGIFDRSMRPWRFEQHGHDPSADGFARQPELLRLLTGQPIRSPSFLLRLWAASQPLIYLRELAVSFRLFRAKQDGFLKIGQGPVVILIREVSPGQ